MRPLEVRIHVDEAPSTRPLTLLVRVDPLAEPGAVLFEPDVPRTAAAVALTLTPEAVFQGCVGERPSGFDLRLPRVPRDRIWLRVSSDRSVAVTLTASPPAPGGTAEPVRSVSRSARLLVEPGASGRASWDFLPEGRE